MKSQEVLIAGSGPAGIAAAIICAQAGLSTVLVTPADTTCFGTPHHIQAVQSLHPGVETLLWELNAPSALSHAALAAYQDLTIADNVHPLSPYAGLTWQGWHVDRTKFDAELLACARAVGVRLVPGQVVGLLRAGERAIGVRLRTGEELFARSLIDGTGRKRALARHFPVQQQFYSPALITCTGVLRETATSLQSSTTRFIAYPTGWLWLTPPLNGFSTWTTLFRPAQRQASKLQELVLQSEPGSVRSADARWRSGLPLATSGVLTIGDAAGQLDPAWGKGVFYALYSGIMAAKSVVAATQTPALESWYHTRYGEWFNQCFELGVHSLRTAYDFYKIDLGLSSDSGA